DRVEFDNRVEWRTREASLKATFPLSAANPVATYNWGVGTVERGNNDEKKYEVPSHQWFDLTDRSGSHGVTVLSDSKYGSDKPDDRTLRLTLLYTPGAGPGTAWEYVDQTTQDWGRHEFVYGLAAHAGDRRRAETDWHALRLNQPLIAFETSRHPGALGKTLSLLGTSDRRVRVLALKRAEETDEVVVRLVELDGRPLPNVRLRFPGGVTSAREVDGRELPVGSAEVSRGELSTTLGPYQLRTFALRLAPPRAGLKAPRSAPVKLPFDLVAAGPHAARQAGSFDAAGRALPAEMLPAEIPYAGIRFRLAPAAAGGPNALVPRGQTIRLPAGDFRRLYILAASADGDRRAAFRVGDRRVELDVQHWGGFVGQWDNRLWRPGPFVLPPGANKEVVERFKGRANPYAEMTGLTPGFIKRAPLAWYASHHHRADGASEPYAYSYLFAYSVELPPGSKTLTLPNDERLRIMAVTVSDEAERARPARPLYDTLERD
ncbi:MAG TPA: glycoside hydrolase family 38 C-terminal domain-containing protein, partial [Pyrinomonadaceae bacterium]